VVNSIQYNASSNTTHEVRHTGSSVPPCSAVQDYTVVLRMDGGTGVH